MSLSVMSCTYRTGCIRWSWVGAVREAGRGDAPGMCTTDAPIRTFDCPHASECAGVAETVVALGSEPDQVSSVPPAASPVLLTFEWEFL